MHASCLAVIAQGGSHVDSGSLAAIITAIVAALLAAATAAGAYLASRRQHSGAVRTSEAAVLWQQAQEMREMLLTQKEKAEQQRDRLIQSYTEQIVPVLTSINTIVQDMADAVADGVGMVRVISTAMNQGGPDAAAPQTERGRQGPA